MGDVTQFNAPPEEKRALVEVGARDTREDMQRKMRGTRIKANRKDLHRLPTRTWVNAMSCVFAFRIEKQNGCQSGCVETDSWLC